MSAASDVLEQHDHPLSLTEVGHYSRQPRAVALRQLEADLAAGQVATGRNRQTDVWWSTAPGAPLSFLWFVTGLHEITVGGRYARPRATVTIEWGDGTEDRVSADASGQYGPVPHGYPATGIYDVLASDGFGSAGESVNVP